jgi:hypothetical protein
MAPNRQLRKDFTYEWKFRRLCRLHKRLFYDCQRATDRLGAVELPPGKPLNCRAIPATRATTTKITGFCHPDTLHDSIGAQENPYHCIRFEQPVFRPGSCVQHVQTTKTGKNTPATVALFGTGWSQTRRLFDY